jgi:hypothetical protein
MSSSCAANSSNLLGNVNVSDVSGSGARLLMTVPLSGFSGGRLSGHPGDDGVTAGDAVRYNAIPYDSVTNPSGGKYIKAQADVPANSEVVGIIESISSGNDATAVIVLSGQINYPTTKLRLSQHIDAEAGLTGSAGGNDVYFLSAATGGVIQNLAPAEATQVIKPIYQVAPDDPFTGQVVNYIGYQQGGQIVVEDTNTVPLGSMVMVPAGLEIDSSSSKRGWHPLGGTYNLDPLKGETYYTAYKTIGDICSTVLEINVKEIPTSNINNKRIIIKSGSSKLVGYIKDINSAQKTIRVTFSSSYYGKFEQFITNGAVINVSNGLLFTASSFSYKTYQYPGISRNNSLKTIRVSDGDTDKDMPIEFYVYSGSDAIRGSGAAMKTHAMSIPDSIKVVEIDATKIIAENENVKVSDLAEALNEMQTKLDALDLAINGIASSTTGNANITKK